MSGRGRRGWALLLVVAALASPVWAHEPPQASTPDPVETFMLRHNLHPALTKLGRGLSNALLGWLEVPLNTQQAYTRTDTAGSTLAGLAIGAVKGVVRTGVGLYETVTFFLPYPERFAPILPTLEYFQKTPTRQRLPLE